MKNLIFLSAFVVLTMMTGGAFAAVIYDNGVPDERYIWFSDTSYSSFRNADSFILQSGLNTITDIHWWGAYYTENTPPQADNFTIKIYETAAVAALPGSLLYTNHIGAVTRADSNLTGLDGLDIYAYSFFLDPLSLTAGTTYWLEIMNATLNESNIWGWSTASDTPGHALWDGSSWLTRDDELAFYLTNDATPVPEPSTFLLLGAGLAGLAVWRRKRS